MIYLLQILNLIDDLDYFEGLFEDLSFEIKELGYKPEELCNELLANHFGLEIEDEFQLELFTKKVMNTKVRQAAINVTRFKRGVA